MAIRDALRAQVLVFVLCVLASCQADIGGPGGDEGLGPDAGVDDVAIDRGFTPSNISRELVEVGADALAFSSGTIVEIDTDTGSIQLADGTDLRPAGVTFTTVPQGDGAPDLGVFSATDLIVPASCEVQVSGKAALVFAIDDKVSIEGTIVVSGGRGAPHLGGPGGFAGGRDAALAGEGPGGAPAAIVGDIDVGGGGASHLVTGGKGGDRADDPGGLAGQTYGAAELKPLVGGSGGAKGGGDNGGPGGGGGGAVQITAFGDIVIANGGIDCGGGGGVSSSDDDAAGGGGSGGAILLEAPSVVINGGILATNGGGGASGGNDNAAGNDGQPGGLGDTRALGGLTAGEGTAGGDGGAGSDAVGTPGVDADGVEDVSDNGGGGGGAGGRIVIRAKDRRTTDAILSPQAGVSNIALD